MSGAFFHKGISRFQAELLLTNAKDDGSFLVRDSESLPGAYVLCLIHQGKVHQYRILPGPDGKLHVQSETGTIQRGYQDLTELIAEYIKKQDQNGLAAALVHPVPPERSTEDIMSDDDDDDDDDDDEEEEEYSDGENEPSTASENTEQQDEDKMPDYDDATKALIAAADEARQQFNDAEAKLREAENKIRDLQSYLSTDYGPNEEYSVLKGNCYEYTDREYTYKLCAFDRATQRPKNGGSETSLGSWGKWDGSGEDKYSAQKYENGQSCWNGPNRSVKVYFKCGTEHKVTSASEPSRCEYAFDFETPTRCSAPPRSSDDVHDEL